MGRRQLQTGACTVGQNKGALLSVAKAVTGSPFPGLCQGLDAMTTRVRHTARTHVQSCLTPVNGGVRGTVHSETDGVELAVGANGVVAVQVAVRQAGGAESDAEHQRHHTDFFIKQTVS